MTPHHRRPPTYLPFPLTAADLACYVTPVPVSNPYFVTAAAASQPSWMGLQSGGMSVVPAAVLAADVLPEYYYRVGGDEYGATQLRHNESEHHTHHHSQPVQRHVHYATSASSSSSSLLQYQMPNDVSASDDCSSFDSVVLLALNTLTVVVIIITIIIITIIMITIMMQTDLYKAMK